MQASVMQANGSIMDGDFDLDVSIVESGPVATEMLSRTDNGCSSTQQSACVTCVDGC